MNDIVYPDSENAAQYVKNVEGWVSRNGLFFGNLSTSESAARYDGCTHVKCKNCGSAVKKGYMSCDACIDKRDIEKYACMPRIEWDGKSMIYSPITEDYYASPDEAEDSLEDDQSIESLRLVVCEPNFVYLHSGYFDSVMPDDDDMPTPVLAAITAFRQAVSKHGEDNPSFRPRGKLGRRTMFERSQVEEMRTFMEQRTFSVSTEHGPSLSLAQVMERLSLTKSGVWHYRRRYGKLLTDFYQRVGQSRPQARFLVSQIEEFEKWITDGKPEDTDLHVADIMQLEGMDTVVRFKNGVTVAIINEDEWRVIPEMSPDEAEKYFRRARQECDDGMGK